MVDYGSQEYSMPNINNQKPMQRNQAYVPDNVMTANIVAGGVVVSRQQYEGATTASEDQRHTALQATFGGNSPSEHLMAQHEV